MRVIRLENNTFLRECPCCKSTRLTKVGAIQYARETYYSSSRVKLSSVPELWRCENCNSGFTQNRVSEEDSIQLYSLGDGWVSDKFHDTKTKKTVDFIDSVIKAPCKILDVGCANGSFLDHVSKKDVSTFGLEYSAANLEQLQVKQHTAYSDWGAIDECFDIITAFDVVEHLYDLASFLTNCYDRLIENGFVILLTGDICSWSAEKAKNEWWYIKHPEHIVFPSRDYFSSLSNFKLVETIPVYPRKFNPRSRSIFKTIAKLSKAALKNLLQQAYYPLPFMPQDHLIIVLQKQ